MNAQQRAGLGVTVALHVLVLATLLSYAPARNALLAAAPIMVSLITPPKAEEPKPAPPTELPKPKPAHHQVKPVEPPPSPIVTAPVEAPSPAVAPPPPAAPPPPPVAAAPTPVAVIPPDFNAAYLNNPKPEYPGMSKRLREQGKVVLRVHVSVAGSVDQIQVRTSSGHQRLDDAALDAVRRWKFVPAKHGSENVAAWVLVPIPFELIGS